MVEKRQEKAKKKLSWWTFSEATSVEKLAICTALLWDLPGASGFNLPLPLLGGDVSFRRCLLPMAIARSVEGSKSTLDISEVVRSRMGSDVIEGEGIVIRKLARPDMDGIDSKLQKVMPLFLSRASNIVDFHACMFGF